MSSWNRSCKKSEIACPWRLEAVKGSEGITAAPACCRPQANCSGIKTIPVQVTQGVGGLSKRLLAGYRVEEAGKLELIRFVARITLQELPILFSWAKHFSERQVPWLIAQSGACFEIWKESRELTQYYKTPNP